MTVNLSNQIFTSDEKARAYFEGIRWPNGAFCPHCGSTDKVYRLEGKSHRPGLFHCNACAGQFTVTTGSVMESSHIPLNKWAFGFRLFAASKKGFSAHQLHRMLGITYKSAWFMAHRIREAMDEPKIEPMGGSGKTIETDETFIGGLEKNRHNIKRKRMGTGQAGKETVAALVERGGKVRSFHIGEVTQKNLRTALKGHIHKDSRIVSDNAVTSLWVERDFADHHTVSHKHKEYVRGDIHTNTIEGYFSILKRGIRRHVSPRFAAAPKPLSGRVRFPLLKPRVRWHRRRGTYDAGDQRRGRQAANVSTSWCDAGVISD